jgi:hypothetical protein
MLYKNNTKVKVVYQAEPRTGVIVSSQQTDTAVRYAVALDVPNNYTWRENFKPVVVFQSDSVKELK